MAKTAKEIRVERLGMTNVKVYIDGEEFPYGFIAATTRIAYSDVPSLIIELPAEAIHIIDSLHKPKSDDA